MQFSTEEFMTLHDKLTAEELEIARLKEQVAQLTKERDYWQSRALKSGMSKVDGVSVRSRFIVISRQKLKALVDKIQDVKLLAFVSFFLQKVLPNEASADDCKAIADIIPLPHLPQLTLNAEGDINVEGDWNDVHDNKDVNF
jgi:uncharacterized coiled-coil protein SlyX